MEVTLTILAVALTVLSLGALATLGIVLREVLRNTRSTPAEVRATLDQVLVHFKAQNLAEKAQYDSATKQQDLYLESLKSSLSNPSVPGHSGKPSFVTDVNGRSWNVEDLEPVFELDQPEPPVS